MAANLAPEDTKIEVGNGASASGQGSVAIGNNAQASGLVGIAIGRDAVASGTDSIAIGSSTKADQTYSVAVGNDIGFTAYAGTAVGQQAYASGDNATAIGTMTNIDAKYNASHDDWRKAGAQSTAIGAYAGSWGLASTAVGGYSKAEGILATAIGYHSQANVDYGTALGDYSEVTAGWGVAIGASSIADRESGVVGAFAPEGADSLTWRANGGAVSVGSATLTRQITNVAAGTADTDAVNVSQLNKVSVEAGKHSVVTEGANITVTPEQAEDGRMQYEVALNNDIILSGDNDAFVNISGSKGTIWASSSVAAGNVVMDGTTATISGLGNTTTAYDGFANGEGKAATEEQLKEISKVAENANQGWNLSTNGDAASKVAPGETVDISGDKNIKISNDGTNVKVELNKDLVGIESISNGDAKMALNGAAGTAGMINGKGASIYMQDGYTVINSKVAFDQNGKISGVAAGEADTDAVNVGQLKAVGATANMGWNLATNGVATEATNVKPGDYVDFSGDKNISVSHDGTKVKVELNDELEDIKSISHGDKTINLDGTALLLKNGDATLAIAKGAAGMQNGAGASVVLNGTQTVINGGVTFDHTGKITNVKAGVADTDAVNVGQLKEAVEAGNTDTHIKPGEYGVGADNTVNMDVVDKNGNKVDTVTIKDVAKASDLGDVNNIASDIKNQDGSHTTVVDAVNNLNNKVGNLNYVEGGKGNYVTNGENTTTSIGKLDKALKDVADTAAKHTKVEGGNNITVTNTAKEGEAANYKVELNKDIDVDTVTANTVTTGQTVMNNDGVKVGTDVSLNKDGLKVGDKVSVSATAVTAGQTSINNDGLAVGPNTSLKADELKVDGKTYIDKNGLNANGMQITNVADGKENSDAVNVGQLKESEKTINNRIDGVENQVVNNTNRINKLGSRVNKVGAGAAALAALHPMDFDPDDKLTFSAGYGNYAGENAAAIGAYYRPDEKVMFSVAGTVGNGENMVNAGVSFALDRTNHVSNSRTALAREVIDLRGQLAVMGAKMAKMEKAFGMLDETKTKLFPDVPANHWAYEYIAKLAGNGYIEGYPDGNFGGDRLMTRYEFAAMLYRAIENGAALEEKIIKEFEPELGRIRVDRISGEDGDRDKIERVRVNDTKGERDHYGNKLAK